MSTHNLNPRNVADIFRTAESNVVSHQNDGGQILTDVPWPEHALFGADHGKWTAKLAERILCSVFEQFGRGEPTEHELNTIRGAALFHDLGRGLKPDQSWRVPEPGHQQRSADIAARVLLTDPNWRFKQNTHAHILQLIAGHRLPVLGGSGGGASGKPVQPPTDPFMVALWDAECLESARFDPNTEQGLIITRERFNQTVSAWAKLPAHRQRWRAERWRR